MLRGLLGSSMQEEIHGRFDFPHWLLMHDILQGFDVITPNTQYTTLLCFIFNFFVNAVKCFYDTLLGL